MGRKIAILVYKRVTKSAAKWKKWWVIKSKVFQSVPNLGRNDNAKHIKACTLLANEPE